MKSTCTKCKKEKAIMTFHGGRYCQRDAPVLEKSDPNESIGIGFRFKETPHGRELKGKKPDLSRKSTHKMRSNMGMNYKVKK